MKNALKNIALMLALTCGFAAAASAQAVTSGTVDFSVIVNEAFDIRSNGAPVTNNAGITGNSTALNSGLSATITVLDASPNANNAVLTANVPFRLRSNRSYQLTATRDGISTANAQDFDSSDIKMGIVFNGRSGANVNIGGSDTPAAGWGVGGGNHVALLGTSGIKIATGDRISNQGNNRLIGAFNGTANFATGNLVFSIKRQYYTPTPVGSPFLEQVQVAISAAP